MTILAVTMQKPVSISKSNPAPCDHENDVPGIAHHVVDETSEEAPAAEVGIVGLKVGSLRAGHLQQ